MDCLFKGRYVWIVGSVCLMASYLWHIIWDLLSYRRKSRSSTSPSEQLKDPKVKDGKFRLSLKSLKAQKKKKPPDSTVDTVTLKKQALLLEEVQKLNQENAERSEASQKLEEGVQKPDDGLVAPIQQDLILEEAKTLEPEQEKNSKEEKEVTFEQKEDVMKDTEPKIEEIQAETPTLAEEDTKAIPLKTTDVLKDQEVEHTKDQTITKAPAEPDITDSEPPTPIENSVQSIETEQTDEVTTSSKRRVTEEDLGLEDHKKSRVEEGEDKSEQEPQEPEDLRGVFKADGVEIELDFSKLKKERYEDENEEHTDHLFIDCTPPPPAPFNHRVVSAKPNQINNFYTINRQEVLGGGRFGQVHKCIENSSGLTLAAKIIKARSPKEKEVVKNEIQVMNQLNHANLIQLYAAYESRNDIILVLEYVDGGELFDRIIDENYKLTELDTVMFIRQICEGLRYMHQMYILHLDLKPENILCVSRLTNKIKIIDFGLARKYQPREKLRVNFGTPEFLSPEVVNFDFVSFNTDMWSLGVITYMLLSGLSPFLGDDENETLNNILSCQWNFEEDEFSEVSEEAKDFISKLLVVDKSWRIGASEALKHPWLSDPAVHFRLHQKKNKCRSRRNSCLPPPES
ncbi:myosin light chain kinase 3 isoform X2 [Labeo rohita]|uniref:myosin light chain kinase 3 isoform X2 n=1 Tax=Labeo rohita TaxID=84645 RepID=UPI0021E2FAB9|nr:myosin light chain kinase 3 isoform X2 [Labeo rohita]